MNELKEIELVSGSLEVFNERATYLINRGYSPRGKHRVTKMTAPNGRFTHLNHSQLFVIKI